MKIGIIGSGKMGGQIGRLWGLAGHKILFSSRNPDKLVSLTEGIGHAGVGFAADAVEFAEVILLAVNYWTIAPTIEHLKQTGKPVIDLTNPYKWSDSGKLERVIPDSISGAQVLQNELKQSIVIKAFSSHPAHSLIQHHSDPPIAVAYTCDDDRGKQIADVLIRDAGFAPVYYGGLEKSRDIELFGMLSNKLLTEYELRDLMDA